MQYRNSWKDFLMEVGGTTRFGLRFFSEFARPRYEFDEFLRQCYQIGYRSLPLIGLTGFIMGLVLTIQLRPNMAYYGVEFKLPDMVAVAIMREIGPVLAALVFAGKISSSMGAELGSMQVTEQIDAMEVSGTNPFKYLIVTRIVASTLMLPVLTLLSDAISLYGSYLGVNIRGTMSFTLYFNQVFNSLSFSDVIPSFIKTFFFGFAVGLIGCYKGYYSSKGTEGVGMAANSAVVVSSLLVFIIDLIAVQITDILGIN
jgi:phospholipid/cholesterol/gamma-HCH transport system permease protein